MQYGYRFMTQSRNTDLLLRAALALVAVAFLGVVGYAVYAPPQRVVVAGEQSPAFTITADGGRSISVPSFGGKLLVLNFWASWCPPCVEETPSLSKFAEDFASQGVVVLAVSVDTSEPAYRRFLQKYKPRFLTVRDAEIHRQYGTFVYPESYIIDSTGKVRQKIAEGADWNNPNLRSAIARML